MSPVSPSDSTEPQDLRCGHPPSIWSSAMHRMRQKPKDDYHGDTTDGRPPYAVIQVQLFKTDDCQPGQSDGDRDFEGQQYGRTLEGIERVIRVNRHSHLYSLIDFGEFLFPLCLFLAGWAAGFFAALELVLNLSKSQ